MSGERRSDRTPGESNCQNCDKPDTLEDMVGCGSCKLWFHFSCAQVTSDISEYEWKCGTCAEKSPKESVHVPVVATNENRTLRRGSASLLSRQSNWSSKLRLLELQMLEEERKLQEKREEERKLQEKEERVRQEERDKEYFARRLEILQRFDCEGSQVSAEEIDGTERVANWLTATDSSAVKAPPDVEVHPRVHPKQYSTGREINEAYDQNGVLADSQPRVAQIEVESNLRLHRTKMSGVLTQAAPQQLAIQSPHVLHSTVGADPTRSNIIGQLPSTLPIYSAATEARKTTYVPHPYVVSSHTLPNTSIAQKLPGVSSAQLSSSATAVHTSVPLYGQPEFIQHSMPTSAPNWQNFSARQVMPKDLPTFSGRPEEWPLFISSFETSSKVCGFSNEENLIRLQKCLKGKALEAVSCRLLLPACVPQVLETLRLLYGRPQIIIQTLLKKIRAEPPPKADKLETLISFALSVQNLCATMEAAGLVNHFTNPMLLQELTDKLPAQIKISWATSRTTADEATIPEFSLWLLALAKSISNVIVDAPTRSGEEMRSENRSPKRRAFLNTHNGDKEHQQIESSYRAQKGHKKCCICNNTCSSPLSCKKFNKLKYNERWNAVKQNKLCRTCLIPHGRNRCQSLQVCGQNNCTYRHHPLLHKVVDHQARPYHQGEKSAENGVERITQQQSACNAHQMDEQSVLFRVVPVVLHSKSCVIEAFAFLDDGSSLTLIEQGLADELQLSGTKEPLCLKWTANKHRMEKDSRRVAVQISDIKNRNKFNLSNVRTVGTLNLPTQTVSANELCSRYSHLRGLPIDSYDQAVPRILIGLDNWRLGLALKYREGGLYEPIAVKTRLGWSVHGPTRREIVKKSLQQQHHSFHHCDCNQQNEEELHQLCKEYFLLDSAGVASVNRALSSYEDQRCIKIMNDTTIRVGNRFETGLLWKFDDIHLPNSFPMAERRMQCLERKMQRDSQLAETLKQKISDYKKKGYIHKLSEEELCVPHDRIWYLPIFTVINPNKPGKIRVVWDAAAKVNGVSLNSMLMKGPDQLRLLPAVLYSFRERRIAICADIREMFHQVNIKQEDKQVQRFLWREDPTKKPDVYLMDVMTFGASCSPSSAQYVKNKNAADYRKQFPQAADAIINHHYVDDLLASCDTVEEAVQLACDVRYVHAKGGFEIRNWISNSPEVVLAMGETLNPSEKNLNVDPQSAFQKVLGMWWSTSSDSFTYSLVYNDTNQDILSGTRKPTKKEVLSLLMKIFDPLGLISNFLVYVKILLQQIWRSGIGWDDKITDSQFEIWLVWIRLLPDVERIRIPRCYLVNATSWNQKEVQLHVFVDASENAYAAVAYFRIGNGKIADCSLVAAKTRVAPLKMLSIPRLELQAAVLGLRLANSVCQNHSMKIGKRYFWSDSKTVLCWINSDQRKYQQFVAFRIGEILETSDVKEWRWCPSKLNVADEATKWQRVPDFSPSSRWFTAPDFLYNHQDTWPKNPEDLSKSSSEELRPHLMHKLVPISTFVQIERFSGWRKLLRTIAWVFRFVHNIQADKNQLDKIKGPINQEEYLEAENYLYQRAQLESFPDEFAILKQNAGLPSNQKLRIDKSSSLYKKSPYLDEKGVIRIRGRIDAAFGANMNTKRPIVLPKYHHITRLIVRSFHQRFHHHNHETVVNEIRQIYSIPQLRVVLKIERKSCQLCKNYDAAPVPPEMAELPAARIAAFTPAFSYTGLDYFGPMLVTVGRRSEKRWGMLMTCLTTRAIHIEIAHSLTTDSCILNLRNFFLRRGRPIQIYCDNGTNFHGAERELREALEDLKQSDIADALTSSVTKWFFNPPASPHMGGSWERLVRSVKNTLYRIMPARNPSEELLRGMMVEIEYIVNSRPLTYVPIDDENSEALTPNHFLVQSSNGVKSTGEFSDDRNALKRNYLTAQLYANCFWKRWIKEYLPTLTRRTKWFETARPIEKGDIVIVVDDSNMRRNWPKARVFDVKAGKDGQVRSATVQTSNGIYNRPAVKLAVLDVQCAGKGKKPNEDFSESVSEDCVCGQYDARQNKRIAGGERASIYEYPWQAGIFTRENNFHCGGSVVTKKHILTAAHCVFERDITGWYVVLGMANALLRDGIRYEIKQIVVYPNYQVRSYNVINDLAIVILATNIGFTGRIAPICLPIDPAETYGNKEAIITGWGRLAHKGLRPQFLQRGWVRIMPAEECFQTPLGQVFEPNVMLCGYRDGVDACQGDSGGPIFVEKAANLYEQVGITSFGIGCATRNSPGIYTKITSFMDWISAMVSDIGFCTRPNQTSTNPYI